MSFELHTALYTDKFKRFLSSIKRTNWQGKNFYPQEPIRKWMTENNDLDPEGLQSNLEFLFREAYKNSSRVFEPAGYSPSVIQNRCLFVFTILLYLNCGSFIHKFQRHEIDDEFLARLSNDIRLEKIVSALETLPNAEGLAKEFLRLRWQFFPAQITYEMDSSFTGNQYILPFIDTEEINTKGGTANVHLYRIQVDLITSPDLHEALGPSKHSDPKFGQCYSLAVKTYHAGSEDSYELEIEAFSGIGDQQGIVKYLGQYHYDSPRGPIHHIMLEYGERDLDEYLADTYPPVMFTEMDAFWTDIFSIAETIRNLHDLSHNGEHVRGWHGDIKPDNILRVHGKYKLADFGFAKFEKNSTQGGTKMDGGTHSYGAPECDVSRDVSVPHLQTIDTWSFGCVLSSVATWVILSSQAYDQYRDYRQREIKILKQRRKQGEQVNAPTADDAFHDGRNVLQAVKDWHDYLRQSIRKCDFFSERVLDLVEHHMLLADPTERYTLDHLCEKLEEILVLGRMNYKQSLRKSGSRELPGSILQFLLEKDLRAPKVATPAEKLKQEARLAPEKSKRVNKSMRWVVGKTANREQVLQEKLEPWLRETTETGNPVASGPQALKGLESQRTNSFGIPHRSESPPRISSHANRGLDEGPSPPPPPARTITEHVDTEDNTGISGSSPRVPHIAVSRSTHDSIDPPIFNSIFRPKAGVMEEPITSRISQMSRTPVGVMDGLPPRVAQFSQETTPLYLGRGSSHQRWTEFRPDAQEEGITRESKHTGLSLVVPEQQTPQVPIMEYSLNEDPNLTAAHGHNRPISAAHSHSRPIHAPQNSNPARSSSYRHVSADSTSSIPSTTTTLNAYRAGYSAEQPLIFFEYYRLKDLWNQNMKKAKWTFKSFGGLVEVDRQLKNYIENRDIMFIVDNSATMRPYWTAVQMVLLTLAMKIGPLDEDGLDLRFTIGYDHNVEGAREWNILKSFEASMKACGAEIGPAHETNMAETLRPILDMYRRQLKKKLTLIILTDGMWSGRANNVEELIAKFLPSLEKQLGKLEERWFSIQFVTFGNDPLALRRMQELDDKMHAKYNVSDAIDTKEWCYEPINMLIMGSITEDGDDHASPPPTSPLSPTQASSSQYLGPSVDQVFMPPQRSASAHSTKSQSGSFRNRLSGLSGKLRGE